MGGKPRKKPLLVKDLISGADHISTGGEIWEVIRRLSPDHRAEKMKLMISKLSDMYLTRGPNKGCRKAVITVLYVDDTDPGWTE